MAISGQYSTMEACLVFIYTGLVGVCCITMGQASTRLARMDCDSLYWNRHGVASSGLWKSLDIVLRCKKRIQ